MRFFLQISVLNANNLIFVELELTYAAVDVILEPPADPLTKTASLFSSTRTNGHADDRGRFIGAIKLAGDGENP